VNWGKLLKAPVVIVVFLCYFPVYNYLAGQLYPVIDANSSNILFSGIVKLGIGIIPFILVIMFFWVVITAISEPSPQYRVDL